MGYYGDDADQKFYQDIESYNRVHKIKTPLFCLNSEDDMVLPAFAIPYKEIEQNENIMLMKTNGGGHLTFYSGLRPRNVSQITKNEQF